MNTAIPTEEHLDRLSRRCYGDPSNRGWRVRLRHRFGYHTSNAWYQGAVEHLVTDGCHWIDIGGGKSLFPHNEVLSKELAERCSLLVGVDPSDNIEDNPFVHERAKSTIEDYQSDRTFDLATLRMVAEHIEQPQRVVDSLRRLMKPGGRVVIYTPNRWSPISLAASLVPYKWHATLAGRGNYDVFPTYYKMNTRKCLRGLFEESGFKECAFKYVDDCVLFQRKRATHFIELCTWRLLRKLRLKYPENTLIGIYEKT